MKNRVVDLAIFMGQSNMAGRGNAEDAVKVPTGWGYEFRAISDPTKLYPLAEPFGVFENNALSGVSEDIKTGSLVSAFAKAYYEGTCTPLVAVSCSKGGTTIDWWSPEKLPLQDAISRCKMAEKWLKDHDFQIRHTFMVWCQGESDGDIGTDYHQYISCLEEIIEKMCRQAGIEKCFIIRIGNHKNDETLYQTIIKAQTDFCDKCEKAILVSTKFADMAKLGMMKDMFHYTQEGYNIAGTEAGINTARYINNQK